MRADSPIYRHYPVAAARMHGAGAKAIAPLCSDALPLYHHANTTGIQHGCYGKGRISMRRSVIAALALMLSGAGLTTAAIAQQPVKLGVLNDQTGLYADLTGMGSVHAARMAVEDYGGKVLGRPIEVIFADHQNKPDIGANIARQWIETEGVSVILDIPNSAVGLAVREITRTHDAIDINTGAATSDLSGKACSPHGVHWSFDTYECRRRHHQRHQTGRGIRLGPPRRPAGSGAPAAVS